MQLNATQKSELTTHETLDFILRHSLQSLQILCRIAAINPGNLRSSLGGNRSMSVEQMRRMSSAVGLQLHLGQGADWSLSIEHRTVINLNVELHELPKLASVVQSLSGRPPIWRFLSAARGRGEGNFWSAVALVQSEGDLCADHGFVTAHIADVLDDPAQQRVAMELTGKPVSPESILSSLDGRWIRLRAGLTNERELGEHFKVGSKAEPTAKEWAQMLAACADYALGPADVISLMKAEYEVRTDASPGQQKLGSQ